MTKNSIDFLLKPKSIAVVGVSAEASKVGAVIFNNIIDSGFTGHLYPVNPKYSDLYGHKCYESVESIKAPVDLIVYAIPASLILLQLENTVRTKPIKAITVISAGFKEIGEEGEELESELVDFCNLHNISLLGPNCLGFINTNINLNASFAAASPQKGNIFLLSQSGAVCTALIDNGLKNNLGYSYLVSYGNKADINEIDLIKYAYLQPETRVVGAYIEEITDGYELYDLIKSNNIPTIILNPGQTSSAQAAIASHTGSLVRSAAITRQALTQAGAIIVESFEQFVSLLTWYGQGEYKLGSNKMAIVTNAGGMGIIASDSIVAAGLELIKFSQITTEQLKQVLPAAAGIHNPIDVIGDATAQRYRDVLIALEEEEVDAILVILTPQRMTQVEETAKVIIDHARTTKKIIVPVFIGGKYVDEGLRRFNQSNIPVFEYIEDATSTIKAVLEYNKNNKYKSKYLESVQTNNKTSSKKIDLHAGKKQSILPEKLVNELSLKYSIDVPAQIVTSNIDKIKNFHSLYPEIVLKATSKALMHKTEHNAVHLNLTNEKQILEAFKSLKTLFRELDLKHDEVIVQEQLPKGEEIFVGIKRDGTSNVYSQKDDKGFGHVIVFGKGGIYTEIYKDVASRLLPLTKSGIEDMINNTLISKIINGARGQKPLAVKELVKLIQGLQQMVLDYPEISDIDINPVILTQKRAIAADIKIVVAK